MAYRGTMKLGEVCLLLCGDIWCTDRRAFRQKASCRINIWCDGTQNNKERTTAKNWDKVREHCDAALFNRIAQ